MRYWRWKLIGILGTIFIGIALIPVTVIELYDVNSEDDLRLIVVDDLEQMTYSFTHSVSHTSLIEHLSITEAYELRTYRVDYQDQSGAGLPEYIDGESTFREEDGWFIIEGLNRISKSHQIHVDVQYDNVLEVNGETVELYDYYVEEKGLIGIRANRISLGSYYVRKGLSAY